MIVIGGGLAGLAAGVALADSGWRVRLFEQRPFLGGRAASYVLPDGEQVLRIFTDASAPQEKSGFSTGSFSSIPRDGAAK